LKRLKAEEHFAEFQKEADLLWYDIFCIFQLFSSSLKDPHIVQYYGIFADRGHYIVTELMTRGDAKELLKKQTFTVQQITQM
jgi:serine/threonine protein kinase